MPITIKHGSELAGTAMAYAAESARAREQRIIDEQKKAEKKAKKKQQTNALINAGVMIGSTLLAPGIGTALAGAGASALTIAATTAGVQNAFSTGMQAYNAATPANERSALGEAAGGIIGGMGSAYQNTKATIAQHEYQQEVRRADIQAQQGFRMQVAEQNFQNNVRSELFGQQLTEEHAARVMEQQSVMQQQNLYEISEADRQENMRGYGVLTQRIADTRAAIHRCQFGLEPRELQAGLEAELATLTTQKDEYIQNMTAPIGADGTRIQLTRRITPEQMEYQRGMEMSLASSQVLVDDALLQFQQNQTMTGSPITGGVWGWINDHLDIDNPMTAEQKQTIAVHSQMAEQLAADRLQPYIHLAERLDAGVMQGFRDQAVQQVIASHPGATEDDCSPIGQYYQEVTSVVIQILRAESRNRSVVPIQED